MNSIPKYNFYRKKYSDELLIDVINLDSIKGNIRKNPVHRVTYYDILLSPKEAKKSPLMTVHTPFIRKAPFALFRVMCGHGSSTPA